MCDHEKRLILLFEEAAETLSACDPAEVRRVRIAMLTREPGNPWFGGIAEGLEFALRAAGEDV